MSRKLLILFVVIVSFMSSCKQVSNDDIFTYDLLPVKSDQKWGYIDKTGKYVINPQFEEAYLFSEGLALVKSSDNKYGYVDREGKFAVNPTYKYASNFAEGLACVTPENGFPTFIDKKGEIKFVLKQAARAGIFNEGLAPVEIDKKWGFVNKEGKIVINPQFKDVSHFHEGLASVTMENSDSKVRLGYIDEEGKIVINAQFEKAFDFKNGMAVISTDGKKYGYIDKSGKVIINPQFDYASNFSEGLAYVRQDRSFGFINEEGKIVINPQFEDASDFKNGMAAVKSGKDNWGYIDREGKFLINPQFECAAHFYDALAPVISSEKIGFINKDGRFEVNPQFAETFALCTDKYPNLQKYFGGARISGFSERERCFFVKSDFFDMDKVIQILLKDADNKNFKGFNNNTTLSELATKYSAKDMDIINRYTIGVKKNYF